MAYDQKYKAIKWREHKAKWTEGLTRRSQWDSMDDIPNRIKASMKEWPTNTELIHCCAIMECLPRKLEDCENCNYGPNGRIPVCQLIDSMLEKIQN